MLGAALLIGLAFIVLGCAGMALRTWRDPNNWHLDAETGRAMFHRWFDLAMFAAIGALCLLVWLLGWGQQP